MAKIGPKEQQLRDLREGRTFRLLRSQGVRRPAEYIAGLKAAVSRTIAETVTKSTNRNAGRKRVHASGAARQKAYRERLASKGNAR